MGHPGEFRFQSEPKQPKNNNKRLRMVKVIFGTRSSLEFLSANLKTVSWWWRMKTMRIPAKENLQSAVTPTLSVVASATQPRVEFAATEDQPAEPAKAEFHLRLEDDLPVSVQYSDKNMDLSARFDKVKWDRYEPIAEGCRRLTAKLTGLDIDEVRISQTLHIDGSDGSPRLTIQLPSTFAQVVASRQFQDAIESFLQQVKKGKHENSEDLFPMGDDVGELAASKRKMTDDMVQEISEQVRAVVGGRTLPGRCVLESPLWLAGFELFGGLGPKPEIEPEFHKGIRLLCGVDGYRKRARVVYLFPNLLASAAPIEVSYSERDWLSIIKEAAACEGQLFEAEFDQVQTGSKIRRTLTKLSKTDGDGLLS